MSEQRALGQSASPRRMGITVLWAVHDRYSTPHVVRAWSNALDEIYGLGNEIDKAKEWMENWGDESGGWRYWTTVEYVDEPSVPDREDEEAYV